MAVDFRTIRVRIDPRSGRRQNQLGSVTIFFGFALVAMMIALAGLVSPRQASAANVTPAAALSVDLHCESTGGGGFLCDAYTSGGVGSLTFTWTVGANASITQNFGETIFGRCMVGRVINVSVRVRDSQGATANDSTSFYCSAVAP